MISPEKILITGGSGFFGKSMLDFLHNSGCSAQITILARHPERLAAKLPDIAPDLNVKLAAGDVAAQDWFDDYQLIIHAATLPASHPDIITHTMKGCNNIAECARRSGAKILYLSSGAVYRESTEPLGENSPTQPATAYGKAKLNAENMLLQQCSNIAIARCFSFIGKYIDMNMHYAVTDFIRNAISRQPIIIQGSGQNLRTYLDAGEWAKWCWKLALEGNGIYNVGSDIPVSILKLAQEVREAAPYHADIVIRNNPTLPGERLMYVPDISKIKQRFDVKPEASLQEMLHNMMFFLINQLR